MAVAFFTLGQAASVTVAAGQGRQVSECVHTCNSVRDSCVAGCVTDCSIYPAGSSDYDACYNPCYDACWDAMRDCKYKCNVRRQHSPTEP